MPKLIPTNYFLCLILLCLFSCKSGTVNLFKPASPHEQYQRKLSTAGLDRTAIGAAWINTAQLSLQKALTITLPYQETGYFAADRIPAATYRFKAIKGQKISISLIKKTVENFMIYIDVWQERQGEQPKLLASADTLGNNITMDIEETGLYLIRLQPELLRSGEYTLTLNTGPSLAFPVKNSATIQSFFGDGRDANARKHEGVDIFARFRTPVVAIASGTITRVNENNLGGKVVWMRPAGKDYTLYYAHLDQQIATEGQQVTLGDTLGLVGNTGNARTTAAHLHFGVYTATGAVDPLPYINRDIKPLPGITAPLAQLNTTMRVNTNTSLFSAATATATAVVNLQKGTILHVDAANGAWYKAETPDGTIGYIPHKSVMAIRKAIRQVRIKPAQQSVYDQPDSLAAIKLSLPQNTMVSLLGNFGNYYLISDNNQQTGWIKMD